MIHFILDKALLESSGHARLASALEELGHTVHLDAYRSELIGGSNPVDTRDECTVLYGSIQFVEQRMKRGVYSPGAYYSRDRFRCSYYMHRLPCEILGNGDGFFLPFAEVERGLVRLYRQFGASRLFIRPDSGAKVFTGLAIDSSRSGAELSSLRQLTSVTDDTMTLVASVKHIAAEYRFFIVGGKVITGSRYMVEGKPSASPVVDPLCWEVAERVASLPWQIDLAYTCDVGMFLGFPNAGPKVVELNAFSTSGLYECDSEALFSAVADIALQEFRGEASMYG